MRLSKSFCGPEAQTRVYPIWHIFFSPPLRKKTPSWYISPAGTNAFWLFSALQFVYSPITCDRQVTSSFYQQFIPADRKWWCGALVRFWPRNTQKTRRAIGWLIMQINDKRCSLSGVPFYCRKCSAPLEGHFFFSLARLPEELGQLIEVIV